MLSVEALGKLNKPRVVGAAAAMVELDQQLEEAYCEPGDVLGRFAVAIGDSRAELESHAQLASLGATVRSVGAEVDRRLPGRED